MRPADLTSSGENGGGGGGGGTNAGSSVSRKPGNCIRESSSAVMSISAPLNALGNGTRSERRRISRVYEGCKRIRLILRQQRVQRDNGRILANLSGRRSGRKSKINRSRRRPSTSIVPERMSRRRIANERALRPVTPQNPRQQTAKNSPCWLVSPQSLRLSRTGLDGDKARGSRKGLPLCGKLDNRYINDSEVQAERFQK